MTPIERVIEGKQAAACSIVIIDGEKRAFPNAVAAALAIRLLLRPEWGNPEGTC